MDSTWILRGPVQRSSAKYGLSMTYEVTPCHLFQILGAHHRIMASMAPRSRSYFHYSWFNDFETQTPNH